jgi:hypothetical protein
MVKRDLKQFRSCLDSNKIKFLNHDSCSNASPVEATNWSFHGKAKSRSSFLFSVTTIFTYLPLSSSSNFHLTANPNEIL